MPETVMIFTKSAIAKLLRRHKKIEPESIAGLGIASPFYQWNWNVATASAPAHVAAWRQIDIRAELDRAFDWPVYLFNDAAVAAGAELMFGAGIGRADFVYAFIGDVLGGGLVLDHHLFPGRNRLAGALGAMLVPAEREGTVPLSHIASLHALGDTLDVGKANIMCGSPTDWGDLGPRLHEWIEAVSSGLAHAVQGAVALLDVDNLVLDGAIPASVRKEVAKATRRKLARIFVERPEPFSVIEGTFGHLGPAIGGASIPLLVQYSNDKDLLFKE